ncbi:hypothetical protein ACH5RR_019183 [Cinchona calisaya]|uniref:Lon N-terminal domain-containing protein n=1 Tax=Cinchona calisaya TaxID=153742 RepID=A0ABD2ZNY8_9GENT
MVLGFQLYYGKRILLSDDEIADANIFIAPHSHLGCLKRTFYHDIEAAGWIKTDDVGLGRDYGYITLGKAKTNDAWISVEELHEPSHLKFKIYLNSESKPPVLKDFENVYPNFTAKLPELRSQLADLKSYPSRFVEGVVTYMVMDDLEVKPMSAISSIALLNKFNVKEVGALEEKVVDLGMDEALKLLKTSLESKTST